MVNFDDFGKIVVRNPLFPYSLLFNETGQTKDLNGLVDLFLENEKFLEGIYWSSISLYNQVLAYKEGKEFDQRKRKKLLYASQKYLIRACSRPTPFGVFAGINIQNIQKFPFPEPVSKRHVRIDTNALIKILHSLENSPLLADHLRYQLNNTVYTVANQFRFLEVDKNGGETSKISSLEKTGILKKIVSLLKENDFSFNSLYKHFDKEFDREEFHAFFRELVEMRFLVSTMELALTTENTLESVKKFLSHREVKETKEAIKYRQLLIHIQDHKLQTERESFGHSLSERGSIVKQCFENFGISIKNEPIFHVDLLLQTEDTFTLTSQELKNIKEAIHVLGKITTGHTNVHAELDQFKSTFVEKYDTEAIPLMEVLDADIGIGFPSNKNIGYNIKDFPVYNHEKITSETGHNLTDWLVDKIEETTCNQGSVEIKGSELQNRSDRSNLLPATFVIAGRVVDNGNILLQNVGGASAISLLSRFSYMSPDTNKLCREIAEHEKDQAPNIILADIIWIPTYKLANISRRISYYDYEIPVFYPSSKDGKKVIFLQDILISINENEIILTSKKLKRRIIPVLSNAHNFLSSTNPIYRFLGCLQYQNLTGFDIRYDFIKSRKRFFPQLFYKNIVLYPAHWILQKSDIDELLKCGEPINALTQFLKKWKVAQYVSLSQADNELFLDIRNRNYVDILFEEVKKGEAIILKQWLHGPPEKSKKYISQFLLPLKKEITHVKETNIKIEKGEERRFFPGSEWAYFKIYCSTGFSDLILTVIYKQVIKFLQKENKIQKWFFIRYLDPHYHIRLRIHLTPDGSWADILAFLKEKLRQFLGNGLIWKLQIDTYQRELERYGDKDIKKSEKIFHIDSELFMKFLVSTDLEDELTPRLLAATKNIDNWLSIYGLNEMGKKTFCKKMLDHFAKEKSAEFLLAARGKYKVYKEELFNYLQNDSYKNLFIARAGEIANLGMSDINISDHIHMSMNRWFASQQREWEYLTYYFCGNYYARMINTTENEK